MHAFVNNMAALYKLVLKGRGLIHCNLYDCVHVQMLKYIFKVQRMMVCTGCSVFIQRERN